jgi:hypothetical protein
MRHHHQQAAAIRVELERLERRGQGKAYPEHVRRLAVAYYRSRRDAGASIAEAGAELGIPWRTVYGWAARDRAPDMPVAGFSPVEILDAPRPRPHGPIVVEHRSGLRIEGLDLDSLAELLRRLS